MDAQNLQRRGIRSKPEHNATTAGNHQSTGWIVFLPEVGAARHWSDYIRGVVVTHDPSVSAEEESLATAVRMHALRKDDINPFRHTPAAEHAMQTRHAQSKREYVIVPKRISEEIKSVERGPATQFREAPEGPAVVTALQANTPVGVFDSYVAIGEAPALSFLRIAVEDGDAFVREYLEFMRRWKRALKSLEGEQRT